MGQVIVPHFQRGQVWVDDKRKAFIRAILSGYPFGSLLLYKNERTIDSKYSLIDGLQRYSTLKRYYDNPLNFIEPSSFCKQEIKQIGEIIKKDKTIKINPSDVEREIRQAINNHFSFTTEMSVMIQDIMRDVPFLLNITTNVLVSIQTHIIAALSTLLDALNVKDLPIPIVIYNGDFNQLPDIFENINTTGTKLTKYDMYAARWGKYSLSVDHIGILTAVEEKYKKATKDTDLEIEGYVENQIITSKEINLFEFCFAMGVIMKQECPLLFGGNVVKVGKSRQKDEVESIGFSLLATILNGSPKNADGLHRYICNPNMNVTELIDGIIDATKYADKLMKIYITDFQEHYIAKYSEYQVVSLIATVFKIKYSVVSGQVIKNDNVKNRLKLFAKNAPKRYLYDCIINYWSGTDGTRVADEMGKKLEFNRYLFAVSEAEWNITLSNWMEEQRNKPMKQKNSVNTMFINYILKLGEYTPIPSKKLEIDLIIPKKRFESVFKNKGGMYAIGNLALIPIFENRSKSELTLYEQEESKLSLFGLKQNTLEKLLYPQRDEIAFVKAEDSFTYEKYMSFLKDRHLYLHNKFMSLIAGI